MIVMVDDGYFRWVRARAGEYSGLIVVQTMCDGSDGENKIHVYIRSLYTLNCTLLCFELDLIALM